MIVLIMIICIAVSIAIVGNVDNDASKSDDVDDGVDGNEQ